MKRLLALLVLASPAAADELVLRNGAVFSGVVHEDGERVVVTMDYGTMTFRKAEVREIRRSDDPLKELETRVQKASTAADYVATALWARDRGLQGRATLLLERALALEPDQETARKALGYERHEGAWLRGDDLQVARGYVKHEGRWLKRETVEQILAQESAEAVDFERQLTARREAEIVREVELAKVELERERLEAERERERRMSWWWRQGWPAYPGVVLLPPAAPHPPRATAPVPPLRTTPPRTSHLFPDGLPPRITSVVPPVLSTR